MFNKVKSITGIMVVIPLIIGALSISPTTDAFSERQKLLYLPQLGFLSISEDGNTISANVNGLLMAGCLKLTPLGEYYDPYADEETKKGAVVANLKLTLTPLGTGFFSSLNTNSTARNSNLWRSKRITWKSCQM